MLDNITIFFHLILTQMAVIGKSEITICRQVAFLALQVPPVAKPAKQEKTFFYNFSRVYRFYDPSGILLD
jgi:hypothetical protein